ncbi:MAG: hypothetical protein NVSMB3_02500 [Acidobacteriaceae bacterium]
MRGIPGGEDGHAQNCGGNGRLADRARYVRPATPQDEQDGAECGEGAENQGDLMHGLRRVLLATLAEK